jgi:hypothetical protein
MKIFFYSTLKYESVDCRLSSTGLTYFKFGNGQEQPDYGHRPVVSRGFCDLPPGQYQEGNGMEVTPVTSKTSKPDK